MEDKSHAIIAVAASFLAFSYIVVGLRCYVRLTITRWGLDDLFVVLSLVIFSGFASLLIYSSTQGLGKHRADIKSLDSVLRAFRSFFLADLLYVAASGMVKISFCLSLLRVVVIGRTYIYAIYAVGAVTAIFTVFYFFFTLFKCSPVDFLWNQIRNPHGDGTCRQYHKVVSGSYAHGSIVCLGDLILAIVPALMLRNFNLNSRTKLSACFLLGFGSVASVATIARLLYVKNGYDRIDFFFTNSEIMIWSAVEIGVSITAVSAMTLKPLMLKYQIFFHSDNINVSSQYDRERIYGTDDDNSSCVIGPGPRRQPHHNPLHKSSTRAQISSSTTRADTVMGSGRFSSEECIFTSRGPGGQVINTSDAIEEDFELIPRGKIQKVVESSTSSTANEPDDDPLPNAERGCTEPP